MEECQRRHLTGSRRLTKEQTIGTEIVLARQTRLDWKSNLAGEFGKVSGPVAALESGLNDGGDARGDGLVHHQHHPADPPIKEKHGVEQVHLHVQGEGGGRVRMGAFLRFTDWMRRFRLFVTG